MDNYNKLSKPLKHQSWLQQMTFINIHCFSEKIRLDVSGESSARQRIHRKNQALFSSEDKSKKLNCRLLQFLIGGLRVRTIFKYSSLSEPQMVLSPSL